MMYFINESGPKTNDPFMKDDYDTTKERFIYSLVLLTLGDQIPHILSRYQ